MWIHLSKYQMKRKALRMMDSGLVYQKRSFGANTTFHLFLVLSPIALFSLTFPSLVG